MLSQLWLSRNLRGCEPILLSIAAGGKIDGSVHLSCRWCFAGFRVATPLFAFCRVEVVKQHAVVFRFCREVSAPTCHSSAHCYLSPSPTGNAGMRPATPLLHITLE